MAKELLELLLEIGLSKYESKVYISLVSEGITAAKNISDITGIPYGKIYEIINSLSYKGLVMMLPSKPMKYKAVSPEKVIAAIKDETQKRMGRIETSLLKDIGPLFEENKNFSGERRDFLVINGRSNVVKRTEDLIRKAENNINIQCSANSLSRLILHKESLADAKARGLKISIAGVVNKENGEELGSLSFCDIKSINDSKNNFISIDGKESLVIDAIPDDGNIIYGRDIGIYAESASFTRFIDKFFESHFEKAKYAKLG
jgi:sugar-specific transcriptional regulator TrmB